MIMVGRNLVMEMICSNWCVSDNVLELSDQAFIADA